MKKFYLIVLSMVLISLTALGGCKGGEPAPLRTPDPSGRLNEEQIEILKSMCHYLKGFDGNLSNAFIGRYVYSSYNLKDSSKLKYETVNKTKYIVAPTDGVIESLEQMFGKTVKKIKLPKQCSTDEYYVYLENDKYYIPQGSVLAEGEYYEFDSQSGNTVTFSGYYDITGGNKRKFCTVTFTLEPRVNENGFIILRCEES